MRRTFAVLVLAAIGAAASAAAGQQPPPPQPFPRAGGGASSAPPAPAPAAPAPTRGSAPVPAPQPQRSARPGAPTEAILGVPGIMFQQSEYLESFDVGRGQKCYLFGTNVTFAEVVAYYKQTLKDSGRELFKAPAMQQFDIGKFQEQTMTTQPGVVVKDYSAGDGYLQVDGTKPLRFKTVIQIVPAPAPVR